MASLEDIFKAIWEHNIRDLIAIIQTDHGLVNKQLKTYDKSREVFTENNTPLLAALSLESLELALVLLHAGADPNICNEHGINAFAMLGMIAIGDQRYDRDGSACNRSRSVDKWVIDVFLAMVQNSTELTHLFNTLDSNGLLPLCHFRSLSSSFPGAIATIFDYSSIFLQAFPEGWIPEELVIALSLEALERLLQAGARLEARSLNSLGTINIHNNEAEKLQILLTYVQDPDVKQIYRNLVNSYMSTTIPELRTTCLELISILESDYAADRASVTDMLVWKNVELPVRKFTRP